jgi:hypothetical protein
LAIAVAHQTASLDQFAICMDRGHGVAESERGEVRTAGSEERIGGNQECSCLELCHPCEGRLEITFARQM